MKKLLLGFGTIVILALFASCANDSWEHPPVSYGMISFRSFGEYQAFFKRYSPPDDYVDYNDLAALGQFKYATITGVKGVPDCRYNNYLFQDKIGFSYSLTIQPKPLSSGHLIISNVGQQPPKSQALQPIEIADATDLRVSGAEAKGYYQLGNLRYSYASDGALWSVAWETKTHQFTISFGDGDSDIRQYDLNADTFVAQLLRESTAEKAIAKLNTRITLSLAWRKFCKYWLPWILTAAISCGTLAAIHLTQRRKKKKEIAADES